MIIFWNEKQIREAFLADPGNYENIDVIFEDLKEYIEEQQASYICKKGDHIRATLEVPYVYIDGIIERVTTRSGKQRDVEIFITDFEMTDPEFYFGY